MRNMKFLGAVIVFAASLIFFTSCNKEDTGNGAFKVIPDAMIMKKKVNDTVKYAPAFYAYANYAVESAEVTAPGGGPTLNLSKFKNDQTTFAWLPVGTDFTDMQPQSGEYNFSVQNINGEVLEDSDFLAPTNIGIPVITKAVYNASDFTVSVKWDTVQNSDSYFVRLLKQDRSTLYTGYEISSDSTNYLIRITDEGWEESPQPGTTYILQLNAVSYEDNADFMEIYYHVNAISSSETHITWSP